MRFLGIANSPARGTTAWATCRYRLPTIMDVPEQTQIYIDSLEPRWFYGIKSFSETSIGAVPGAISNAIYNACGVRIREHPITREKIMAGLRRKRGAYEEDLHLPAHHRRRSDADSVAARQARRAFMPVARICWCGSRTGWSRRPRILVDIKTIDNLRYIKEDAPGRRADRRCDEARRDGRLRAAAEALPDAGRGHST